MSAVLVKKKGGGGGMNCRNLPIVCFQNTFQSLWGGMGLICGFFFVSLFCFQVCSCMKVKSIFCFVLFWFMDCQPQFC